MSFEGFYSKSSIQSVYLCFFLKLLLICKFWRAKNTFLCKKSARTCIYPKKRVILQRKIIKTEKYARD